MNGLDDNVWLAIVAGEGVLTIVALIWVVAITGKLSKLKKAHKRLVGETGVPDLEGVLLALHNKIGELEDRSEEQEQRLAKQEKRLTTLKGRVGVHRFNAFADSGSDLSFSVAIVNDEQDGVVITGIHGREQTFLYAKPLDKGQSAYMLSPEEKTAISQASQKE
ncbi:DUF4446 domain-containing protein [Cohnella lubricantis]|uniref:DUF4446 family protein n=1 Tax=Cohnella lubricantis TaxID=2163172 RepID=A0A841TAA9_9BACL|nr:DUF4446 family protein [Cohnella lubricantis]MBB6678234.1 DUF4446 family protein [Cohnella lubricantis]MBP2120089.1 hypothetical protein [Cohnella lubricantis]